MRSGKTGVPAIRSTGLQEVQRTDSRAHDPLIHTMQRARERSVLFIRKAEAHDPPPEEYLYRCPVCGEEMLVNEASIDVASVQPNSAGHIPAGCPHWGVQEAAARLWRTSTQSSRLSAGV